MNAAAPIFIAARSSTSRAASNAASASVAASARRRSASLDQVAHREPARIAASSTPRSLIAAIVRADASVDGSRYSLTRGGVLTAVKSWVNTPDASAQAAASA